MKILKLTLISLIFAATAYTQVYNKPTQVKSKAKVVKTISSRMTGTRAFVATAYSLRGRTASGEYVRQGIIAADPRVLPIGTKVYIEGMGTFVVKDTGGFIKGNRVDIWMPKTSQAMSFGRRNVQLTVISYPN